MSGSTYAPVDVANMALSRLGARSIATLNDNSVEARACNRLFNVARDMMLAAADWRFATARSPLAQSGNAETVIPFPWTYEYLRPAYCIKPRFLTVAQSAEAFYNAGNDDRVPYEEAISVVGGQQVGVIWTTVSPAMLCYTYQVANVSLWEPGFVSAFSMQLASEICMPITGNGQLASAMREAASQASSLLQPQGVNEGVNGRGSGGSAQINAR